MIEARKQINKEPEFSKFRQTHQTDVKEAYFDKIRYAADKLELWLTMSSLAFGERTESLNFSLDSSLILLISKPSQLVDGFLLKMLYCCFKLRVIDFFFLFSKPNF